jgi:hypothetical protein
MANADEKMFVDPGDEIRILINRDPSIKPKTKKDSEQNPGNAE